jgi:three-Cys-motif partner protein
MMDDDGLPVDEVGAWAKDKHERLRKYTDASRAARRKFISGSGGATYLDLFCGYGRSVIRETGAIIDGSPIVAFKCASSVGVPFSSVHLGDLSEERCTAAQSRVRAAGGAALTYVGEAEVTARQMVETLNPYGLHFALLDPYNLQDLPFAVLQSLSTLKRIDILIHVSAQDLQRNLDSYVAPGDERLDRFAPGWRAAVNLNQSQRAIRAAILSYWARKMEGLGLPPAQHAELVSGATKNQRLYWLVFASRSEFAKKLWNEIRALSGQRTLL